ncbi:efflux RND transporter periplasmic adaptor subunit [Marinoscillum sp.]|uniref:efflux RND transporter periplasmic adaptor subunit n=1 Tax=Marinoscillum sp. TaxID=2024838 RepID=UPI003BA9244C
MKRILIGLVVVIIIAAFVGTGYFLYQKSEEPPIVFETDQPFRTDIIKKTIATGSIVPRKEVALKSQVSGVVDKLYVEEGANVKVGDLIAKIKIIPNVVALNNAQAQLSTAQINYDNAEKELKRQKELFDERVISEFDYNQFLLDFKLRKQEVEAAENNLELIKEGSSQKTGNVSNLVRSTVDGMILDIPVKEGTFIIESNTFNEGTSIATIADMSEMIFEGKVDESEVGKISEGMELALSVGAIEGVVFDARLEFISPKGETDDGAIKFDIKAAVSLKDDYFLRAGYSATADIILQKAENVLAIKESNLIFDGEEIFVEVQVSDQQFERRKIETGLSDGINIQIAQGLQENEQIKKL